MARSIFAIESPPVSLDDIRWRNFVPSAEVYIDTSLQFTPAENATPDVDVKKDKLALWLNVENVDGKPSTNLCVYASLADLAPVSATRTSGIRLGARHAVTTVKPQVFKLSGIEAIQSGRWYRLTVRAIKDVTRRAARMNDPSRGVLGFQIYLNGVLLTADQPSFTSAYTAFATSREGWLQSGDDAELLAFLRSGTVFVSLCGESADDAVGRVDLRGEGEMDDVDVSAEAPAMLGVSSLDFTLNFPAHESVVSDLLVGAIFSAETK